MHEIINNCKSKLMRRLHGSELDVFENYPIERYIRFINAYPDVNNYDYVGDEVRRIINEIKNNWGPNLINIYHKLVLLELIKNAPERIEERYGSEIKNLYCQNYRRILNKINSEKDYIFDYCDDSFCKDLAVANQRMIPVGARKIHLSQITKRIYFKKGVKQFISCGIYTMFVLKGVSPLYELHTDIYDADSLAQFNDEGHLETFKRIAQLLMKDNSVKGVFGSSWFYDPKIPLISPRFKYLHDLIFKNNCRSYYLGTDEKTIKNATMKSMTRRKLYQDNKYMPTSYMIMWHRKDMINWYKKEFIQK